MNGFFWISDIGGVTHVINYDIPNDIDEYVQRIGRTGRLGNKGLATSFFDPEYDGEIASQLSSILKQANQTVRNGSFIIIICW